MSIFLEIRIKHHLKILSNTFFREFIFKITPRTKSETLKNWKPFCEVPRSWTEQLFQLKPQALNCCNRLAYPSSRCTWVRHTEIAWRICLFPWILPKFLFVSRRNFHRRVSVETVCFGPHVCAYFLDIWNQMFQPTWLKSTVSISLGLQELPICFMYNRVYSWCLQNFDAHIYLFIWSII